MSEKLTWTKPTFSKLSGMIDNVTKVIGEQLKREAENVEKLAKLHLKRKNELEKIKHSLTSTD